MCCRDFVEMCYVGSVIKVIGYSCGDYYGWLGSWRFDEIWKVRIGVV